MGLHVFWLAGGVGLLVYFVVWVLDFGVDVLWFIYWWFIVVFRVVLVVVTCLLGAGFRIRLLHSGISV